MVGLQAEMLQQADEEIGGGRVALAVEGQVVAVIELLKQVDGQGLMLYTFEGGHAQLTAGFVGDPRRVGDLAPEFDLIADGLFARIRAAGLNTGVTVTPWRLERCGNAWVQVADPLTAEAELDAKITYARQRWGCAVFYVNVASPGFSR